MPACAALRAPQSLAPSPHIARMIIKHFEMAIVQDNEINVR